MDAAVLENLLFEVHAVGSDVFRLEALKNYKEHITNETFNSFLDIGLGVLQSEVFQQQFIEMAAKRVQIHVDLAVELVSRLTSDVFRCELCCFLFKRVPESERPDCRRRLLPLLHSEVFRAEFAKKAGSTGMQGRAPRRVTTMAPGGMVFHQTFMPGAMVRNTDGTVVTFTENGLVVRAQPQAGAFDIIPLQTPPQTVTVVRPAPVSTSITYPAEVPNEPSMPEGTPDDKLCSLCMDRGRATVTVPCGHTYACVTCIRASKPTECAMCRKKIEKVIHLFQ